MVQLLEVFPLYHTCIKSIGLCKLTPCWKKKSTIAKLLYDLFSLWLELLTTLVQGTKNTFVWGAYAVHRGVRYYWECKFNYVISLYLSVSHRFSIEFTSRDNNGVIIGMYFIDVIMPCTLITIPSRMLQWGFFVIVEAWHDWFCSTFFKRLWSKLQACLRLYFCHKMVLQKKLELKHLAFPKSLSKIWRKLTFKVQITFSSTFKYHP